MPSASGEDRERMVKWFGDISERGPEAFLKSRGYVLVKGWVWYKPCESHTISNEELFCLYFLVDEWDYGGIVPADGTDSAEYKHHRKDNLDARS